jgi:DNA polymerase sigma
VRKDHLTGQSSALLHFYALYDPRFSQMVRLLKFWAKGVGMGVGEGPALIPIEKTSTNTLTSYTLVIMIIFFLQQKIPRVLPLLSDLEKLVAKQEAGHFEPSIKGPIGCATNLELVRDETGVKHSYVHLYQSSKLLCDFFAYYSSVKCLLRFW